MKGHHNRQHCCSVYKGYHGAAQEHRETQTLGQEIIRPMAELIIIINRKINLSATSTRCITLDPGEVTASINIKVKLLGWMAYVDVHRVVAVRSKEPRKFRKFFNNHKLNTDAKSSNDPIQF
jgi:hypothetical protein